MGKRGGAGPNAIRAVKLMKYLIDGHYVDVGGKRFVYSKSGDPVDGSSVEVSDFNWGDILELSDGLDGHDYNRVMNYKRSEKQ